MLDWIISFCAAFALMGAGVAAHNRAGTPRKDGRAHQVPWRGIMIGCVFGLFLVVVHMVNLLGVETGPENSPFGRY